MADTTTPRREFLGHPIGLYILFFTELWERFSYYGMRALLVLYLVAETREGPLGGLGWEQEDALALYGWYTMLVYVMSIPGGLVADKLLGRKRTVMVGGLTLCAGHLVLALPGITPFYTGLGLIVLGVGMLKPNISSMVGDLYKPGDKRRDKGFNIFYMGINIGAFGAGIIVGTVGEKFGWHYGFGLAGIGMLLGQAVYVLGRGHLKGIGELSSGTDATPEQMEAANRPLTKVERDRVGVMFLSFFLVIIFWGAFEQGGGLMNLFAAEHTDLMLGSFEVPATSFQSLNPLYIILFAVPVANFWVAWGRRREDSSLFKMAIGTMIMGWGFLFMLAASMQVDAGEKAWMGWLVLAYLFHTLGELCASPVALSFVTKLAPVKYAALMMGAYFAATGLGNKVAGLVGEMAVGDLGPTTVFIGVAAFTSVIGILVILSLKPLKRLTHGAEDQDPEPAEPEPSTF
ncbi:MAG: peptide MFS transporter [Deltaproteobacteria bacterium]|nr:peptide MFS transporter [Deltaproteobacteria bacterium]